MPSVNTTSVREQLQALKAEYQRLCANGTMAEEACTLFQALLALVELLMAVFMEKRTPKTPRNSGRPSSQTDKADETATQPGANSKGKRCNAARASHTRTVESVEVAPVSACERCGEDLRATPCQDHERRTRIDIVFEKVVSIEQLLAQPVLHVDETSLRVDKKKHWIHVCSSGDITLKFRSPDMVSGTFETRLSLNGELQPQ